MRAAGLEPAQAFRPYGFSYHFGFRRLATHVRAEASLWSGLSLHLGVRRKASALGAARLVSTPSRRTSSAGLARDCHLRGFPDFEQFCFSGFPESTQIALKSVASTSFATPA